MRCNSAMGQPFMKEYQSRVIAEKADLDAKLAKLQKFLSETKASIDGNELHRLRLQALSMEQYSLILEMRIDAFE